MNYNEVRLAGRLAKDCIVRETGPSVKVMWTIVENRRWRLNDHSDWQEKTIYHDCAMYGPRAVAFARFHKKGSVCFVEGKLEHDQWTDKETGELRRAIYVKVHNWIFVWAHKTQKAKDTEFESTHLDTEDLQS